MCSIGNCDDWSDDDPIIPGTKELHPTPDTQTESRCYEHLMNNLCTVAQRNDFEIVKESSRQTNAIISHMYLENGHVPVSQ